jgi:murein DD-endopeptidase MepM/ murein hydrolase activator NlpD
MINPVKGLKLDKYPNGDFTQWFGENPALYAKYDIKGHNGVDIVRPHGEVMYAIEDCTVVQAKDDPAGFGRHLRLISDYPDEKGRYREWTYGHNSRNLVKQNDKVVAGQAIALMGNTGFVVSGSTPHWKYNPFAGTHLHLGLRYVKRPKRGGWAYEGSTLKIDVLDYGNGYKGAVNPVSELWEADDKPEATIWKESAFVVISLAKTLINQLKQK